MDSVAGRSTIVGTPRSRGKPTSSGRATITQLHLAHAPTRRDCQVRYEVGEIRYEPCSDTRLCLLRCTFLQRPREL